MRSWKWNQFCLRCSYTSVCQMIFPPSVNGNCFLISLLVIWPLNLPLWQHLCVMIISAMWAIFKWINSEYLPSIIALSCWLRRANGLLDSSSIYGSHFTLCYLPPAAASPQHPPLFFLNSIMQVPCVHFSQTHRLPVNFNFTNVLLDGGVIPSLPVLHASHNDVLTAGHPNEWKAPSC